MKIILILFILLGLHSVSAAKKRKKRVYTVDFQNELITGHGKNPNILQLFHQRQLEYEKLVKLRENFLPEMRRTSGEIE